MADKTSYGGGGCPHNNLVGCVVDKATGQVLKLGAKTCQAYHFRPMQVSGAGVACVRCGLRVRV